MAVTAPDFAAINAAARANLPRLLVAWLPSGRREGREWVARNPKRADRHLGSFKTNLTSGAWSDFATDEAGGDPISLFAYLNDLKQGDAARRLASDLGIGNDESVADVAGVAARAWGNAHREDNVEGQIWRPLMPVPDDAPALTVTVIQRFAPSGFEAAASFLYTDGNGAWLGTIVRFDRKPNGVPAAKEFRTLLFCSDGQNRRSWRSQGFPVPRPLFGLQSLAATPAAPVIVCEGEKSAEAAARLFPGHVGVTSPNGSKSAGKADWSMLAGRHVVIWPDADAPGVAYAREVAQLALATRALSVRIVTLPASLPGGWDLADTLPDRVMSDDLSRWLATAKDAEPSAPLPLYPEPASSEPFPVAALGPVLAPAAAAIARKVQVPLAIAGQSVLAAAALAAQAHADVAMHYGQTRPLSLFFVTVAASGDRKSTADNEALWPVSKREAALREEHKLATAAWVIRQSAWAAERKKIEADKKLSFDDRQKRLEDLGEEPPKPLSPFLVTGDLTIEGLTKNWVHAHAALGLFTAEAGVFTGGHGMSEDARLRTAALLSEVWDGKPIKRVRAQDGVTILPGRRLSIHLMVQPDAAAQFLGNGTLRDQGLLSRILVAAPESLAGTRLHRTVDPADDAAIRSYGARMLALLETAPPLAPGTRNELTLPALTIEDDAVAALIAFADHIETQCGSSDELKPIADFAAKAAEHAARIAGVLAIVDSQRATSISLHAMENALVLADWYVAEALRLHQVGRADPKLRRAKALLDWLQHRDEPEIAFRTILQFGPGSLRTKAAAEEVIGVLCNHGWLLETSAKPRSFVLLPTRTSA